MDGESHFVAIRPPCITQSVVYATTLIRRVVLLILVALTIGLTPAALASPPDPHWLTGLYDDADHDDVVLAITSSDASVETQPPSLDWALGQSRVAVVALSDESPRTTPGLS